MSTTDTPTPDRPVLSLSLTALVAGALAAVTSAVVGSHLGTAGTLGGAAAGSIIGAVATAVYSFGLQRTWHALRGLSPRRARLVAGVLLAALASFLVALGAITGIEQATGTTLAGQPGTTVAQAGRAASGQRQPATEPAAAAASASGVPTAQPTPAPTVTVTATPSPTPSATGTPAPSAPAASPEPSKPAAATPQPSAPTAPAAVGAAGH